MENKLNKLKEMMSGHMSNPLLDNGDPVTIPELFRECYIWHDYRKGDRLVGTFDCGSVKLEDTPKALYRLLYLLRPEHVDFAKMYKTGTLIDFTSPDQRFVCSFQLFKYEAALAFGCLEELIEGYKYGIITGSPRAGNGLHCKDPLGKLWFAVAEMALNYEHEIYSGNNFVV